MEQDKAAIGTVCLEGDDRKGCPYALNADVNKRNVPKVSQTHETPTQNTVRWYILPNLCFARKKALDFVIFPEIMLDNGGGVWYHIDVR